MITRFEGEHAFLSNFYPSPFVASSYFNLGVDDEVTFPTVEHWLQAHKATSWGDFVAVLSAPTPGLAKRAGRNLSEIRPGWDEERVDVMYAGLSHKFADERLARLLVATGEEDLVEGNDWGDRYWGAVWDEAEQAWVGENQLGLLLMYVRGELLEQPL